MLARIILIVLLAWIVTQISALFVEKLSLKKGIVADDAHKLNKTRVPKVGGLGFSIGLIVSIVLVTPLVKNDARIEYINLVSVTLIIVFISTIIGLIDDVRRLSGKTKVLLTLIPGIIVAITDSYMPYIEIPFLGTVNASIVYPILLPIVFAVSMNAINMVDTHNGLAPLITTILVTTLFLGLTVSTPLKTVYNHDALIILYIVTLSSMLAYLPFNLYPSRMFNGDTGSLTWGALLAFLAITSKLEVLLVFSAMPVVTNGFTILSSIKGFIEHSQLRERPVKVDKARNLIIVNTSDKAPLTLASMAVALSPLKEDELVCTLTLLVLLSSIASILVWVIL